MICRQLNCLFVHIPKVAGQSMERVILDAVGLSWDRRGELLMRPNTDPGRGPPRLAHLTAGEYRSLAYVGEREWAAMYKFAFVRNPWDRLVSEFNFRTFARATSFREFVLERFPTAADDDYATGEDHYRHVLPQSQFIHAENGRCLVDFVGRFERLEADFAIACRRVGLADHGLQHTNRARMAANAPRRAHRHYTDYYDADTREFVAGYYAADIANFDYRFGG